MLFKEILTCLHFRDTNLFFSVDTATDFTGKEGWKNGWWFQCLWGLPWFLLWLGLVTQNGLLKEWAVRDYHMLQDGSACKFAEWEQLASSLHVGNCLSDKEIYEAWDLFLSSYLSPSSRKRKQSISHPCLMHPVICTASETGKHAYLILWQETQISS